METPPFKQQFAELMQTTNIPSNAPEEEKTKIWKGIYELLLPNIPKSLFRFRKCNTDNFIALQKGEIPLCVASAFSDRYDSLIFVDEQKIKEQVDKIMDSDMMKVLVKAVQDGSIFDMYECLFDKEAVAKQRKESMQYSPEERIQQFIKNIKDLPQEAIKLGKHHIDFLRNDTLTKIACFSENIRSLNMWDLYADGYKGFALEYDFRKFIFQGCHTCKENLNCLKSNKNYSNIFPVLYSKDRYDATENFISLLVTEVMRSHGNTQYQATMDDLYWYKPYLYKNKDEYEHEQEWRIISRCPFHTDEIYTNISDLGCLQAIYYGPHIEKRYKDFLHEIALFKELQEYEVEIDVYNKDYSLKINPIES